MNEETVRGVAANSLKKGDVLGTARFAGVLAAKNAATLVPLSATVLVRATTIDFHLGPDFIGVAALVEGLDDTGVEMPAFSAVTAAVLTIYDMCKSADRTMAIGPVELVERSGGASSTWRRSESGDE